MERAEPLIPYSDKIEHQVRTKKRLSLYFDRRGDGFAVLTSKKPNTYLARAIPASRLSIRALINEEAKPFVNEALVPLPSDNSDVEALARALFTYLIPRYFPQTEGRPLDLYRMDQSKSSSDLPDTRIRYVGNNMVITHPYQEHQRSS